MAKHATKKINSRAKGAAGERELAAELKKLFGVATRRGQQFSGVEGQDVVGFPNIHIECKRVQALNIHLACEQAVRDAKPDQVPTVFHRKNNRPWLVTVRLQDLKALADAVHAVSASCNVGSVLTSDSTKLC